jgi:hypothetical protein
MRLSRRSLSADFIDSIAIVIGRRSRSWNRGISRGRGVSRSRGWNCCRLRWMRVRTRWARKSVLRGSRIWIVGSVWWKRLTIRAIELCRWRPPVLVDGVCWDERLGLS